MWKFVAVHKRKFADWIQLDIHRVLIVPTVLIVLTVLSIALITLTMIMVLLTMTTFDHIKEGDQEVGVRVATMEET